MIIPKFILTAITASCIFFSSQAQNVGIGTTTPESRLQVTGKVTVDSLKIIEGAGTGKVLTSDSAGNAKWTPSANIAQVKNGIFNDTGTIKLGGALTQNTNIETGNYSFKIGKGGPLQSAPLTGSISSSIFSYFSSNLWQSFTCPRDATLDSIQIVVRNIATSGARAYLFEGEGINGNLLATSDPFSYPVYSASTLITVLKTALPLEEEKIYTLYITNIGGWEMDFNAPYPHGVSSTIGDFNFIVHGSHYPHTGFVVKSNGASIINGNASITGKSMLEFGGGIFPKEINAGKIGYQSFSPDALDIVGAGTNGTNRKITFWAEGGTTFHGPIIATIAQEAVHVPTLDAGWVAFGNGYAPPAFWKDKEGVVHLRGLIRNAAPVPINGQLLFTLPSGYRPSGGRLMFTVNNNNDMGRIDIATNGDVVIENIVSNTWLNLTGISFRTN